MPIEIISKLKPINNGQFPVVEDVDISGGYQVRVDLPDRDAIPEANRKEGMLVYVQSDATFYTLIGGITNLDWGTANLGGGSTVIFQPGGTTSAPIYSTWSEVVEASLVLSTFSNPVTILIDESLAACTVPTGTWDFGENITLAGIESQPFPQLNILDGAEFTHSPVAYKNLDVFCQNTFPTIVGVPANFNILIEDVTFSTTGAPLYQMTTDLFLNVYGYSIIGDGSIEVFQTTGNLLLYAYDGTKVLDNALIAGSYTVRVFSGAASVSQTQVGPITITADGTTDLDVWGSGSYGPTVSRPVVTTLNPGTRFFDTTINKPIWWNGSSWIEGGHFASDYPGSSVAQQRVQGVISTPGWTVVGGFFWVISRVPTDNPTSLELILAPSTVALTVRARIVDADTLTLVPSSLITLGAGSITDQFANSGNIYSELSDEVVYQIQVECTGGALTTDFVTVRSGAVVVI